MPPREPSVDELREESERSREALASTVGELRDRVGDTAAELKTLVSPTHIKQEFKDYIRAERESFVEAVQRKAQENPLQVAAVGAAIAYPAWRLLRAIPTPLLLIGAGLFLTSKRGQQSAKEIKTKIDGVVQQGKERVADVASGIQSDVEDRIAGARYTVEEVRDTVSSGATAVIDKTRARFHDATDAVKGVASGIANDAAAASNRVAEATIDGAESVKARATALGTNSRDTFVSFVNDNPLLVAGIGAAVGAFIAASIPGSEAENRLFGAGSKKLKDKAREAATQGLEKAGDMAAEAAGSVAAAAAREGLDAGGVRQALSTVADSVRAVADRGVDTALGSTPKPIQQPLTERNPS